MFQNEYLKRKILKTNYLSIFIIVIIFAFLSFISVYYVLYASLQRDIEFTKKEYITTQKSIIKNQVQNLVDYIDYMYFVEKRNRLKKLSKDIEFLSKAFNALPHDNLSTFLNKYIYEHSYYSIVVKNNKEIVFQKGILPKNFDIDKLKENKLNTLVDGKDTYFARIKKINYNNDEYKIALLIPKSTIDSEVKSKIVDFIHNLDFIFNNGYISIIQILNFNGGKNFAKFIAYPKNPSWEGFYLDSSKKDAKGREYRKEYLKLLREKKEGFFVYWFKKNGKLYKKISYVKLYKPFNWAVFAGVYINEVNNVIEKKKALIKKEIKQILRIYVIMSMIFLIIVFLITKYENKMLKKILDTYEAKISKKNQELQLANQKLLMLNDKLENLNKNLQQEVEKKTKELLQSYITDKLTNLPNREKMLYDLKKLPKKCVALLNIDSFKEINDFYGIEIGDEVLKKVGEIISKFTPVYKLSADEYGIISTDCKELKELVNKVINHIEKQHLTINGLDIEISLSAGIGENIEDADMALKYAKGEKIGKVVVFNENLEIVKNYEEYVEWKKIIKNAIREEKIIPYVQPIVDANTKAIRKYEALIRLEHNGNIYSPFFFLEHAKRAGLYVELQKIMIKKTFEVFSKLDVGFSINLSVMELSNSSFKKYLLDMIDKYDVSDKLTIELLEDEKLQDEELLGFLIYLSEMVGVKIAIDDFGSGNSNLSYLIQKMPVSILKIDGSLIKEILSNKNNQKLIKVLVLLAKIFNLKTVAEFVENEAIAKMLENYGVDCLQGYYFSAPFDIRKLKERG